MLRSASRDVPGVVGHGPAADARLPLVEELLASTDLRHSAQSVLDWLARHAGVSRSACLVLDGCGRQLTAIAGHGVSEAWLADFPLFVDEPGQWLVEALWTSGPQADGFFGRRAGSASADGFHVLPLRHQTAGTEPAEGLLLAAIGNARAHAAVGWAAQVLGNEVHRLRSRETLAETRFGRERTLLYAIINTVTDPILLTDAEGRLIIANSAAERLFAASEGASEGWRRAVALNNILFSAVLSGRAAEDVASSRRELVLADPLEGSDLLVEIMSTVLRDAREGTTIVSVLRNVSDLGQAGRQIEESHKQLRAAQAEAHDQRRRLELIIDSVADPILVTDPHGRIVLMNARADRLFQAAAGEREDVHRRVSTNGARFSSFVSTLLSSGGRGGVRGDIDLLVPDTGGPLPVRAIAGTVLSGQGELMWVVTILHDRTEELERARLFEQLRAASEELEARVQAATAELAQQNELLRSQRREVEQASALKSQFLTNMSHEFRTPLNAILGYTQMLLQGVAGDLNPAQRATFERIEANGRHLLALISDILDLSRIEAGRMPMHVSKVSLPALIDEVFVELDPLIKRSRVRVSRRVRRRLPVLESDRSKVKQILLNLLSNALKFTDEGSVRVAARYLAARRSVAVTVRDTGIGIPESDRERIFEDFLQLDSSPSREFGGTGLGLSICRRLATMLGGRITVTSKVGVGSAFTLWLPVKAESR